MNSLASRFRRVIFVALLLWVAGAATIAAPQAQHVVDSYQVVHTYPHDSKAFTQGLIYVDGHLYESTGLDRPVVAAHGRTDDGASAAELQSIG